MSRHLSACLVLIACLLAQSSYGAGFGLYEGSARGVALGGTMVGRADDPSAIFYNPAGITQLDGLQLMLGVTPIKPGTTVETLTQTGWVSTECEDNLYLPPHFYASYQANEKTWLGFGMYSRFGLGTEFDENWPGRYNSYNACISSLSFNQNLALKLTDSLSLAAGVSAVWFDMQLDRKLPYQPGVDLDFAVEGDSIGYGFNVALRYEIASGIAFGAAYQSEVDQEVEGSAKLNSALSDASGDVTLPDMLFLGLAMTPADKLSVEVGAIRTGWSSYDQLAIELSNPALIGTRSIAVPKDWENVWRYQVGVEYELSEALDLRVGFAYDEEPIPLHSTDYVIPANDRLLYSIGVGYTWNRWTVDVSYTYLDIRDRDVPARLEEGVLQSRFREGNAHIGGLSISTKL